MPQTVELKIGKSVEFDGLKIVLRNIIYEELTECLPDYPGGSGVVAELVLILNGKTSRLIFDQLPEGYESHLERECEGFLIQMKEIGEDSVKILVEKQKA